jgi:hypothetical protein
MANRPDSEPVKARPAHELRLGTVKAAVWKNETELGTRFNTTFERIYRDERNQWRSSDSFGRDDLLLLAKLADQVHTWILGQGAAADSKTADSPLAAANLPKRSA